MNIKLTQRIFAILVSLAVFIVSLNIVNNIVISHPNMNLYVVMILLIPVLVLTGLTYKYSLGFFEKRNNKNE